ncbi:MAG: glycogen-binding domain-containing protein [Ferruginibacter sp.]
MEMMTRGKQFKKCMLLFLQVCFLVIIVQLHATAQSQKIYTIKKGKMYIELGRQISEMELDKFIDQFNLAEIGLTKFLRENNTEGIKKNGWDIEKNDKKFIAISKPLYSSDNIDKPGEQLLLSIAKRFPPVSPGVVMGCNKFKKDYSFLVKDSLVQFYLRGNLEAKRVILAGSFNNFSPTALRMEKIESGWVAFVVLTPGKYWYKFIVDGNWIIDPDNNLREGDGEGNTNSVYYKANKMFRLNGYTNSKIIYLAGSFNNWQKNELPMKRTTAGWELPLYLNNGTYTYRFIEDGHWMIDPGNPEKVPNEFGEYNSVVRLGTGYLFRLNGFTGAKRVILTGSFNGWRKDELFMNKTATGWELLYTLGKGNYEYRFVVDATEIMDPANPVATNNGRKNGNSVLVLGANHTFRLKGFEDAGKVVLAGDFNSFNENAFLMHKEGNEWICAVYLSPGKHLYKFVVDNKWIIDPANKLWEQNEYGTGNSVIWVDAGQ